MAEFEQSVFVVVKEQFRDDWKMLRSDVSVVRVFHDEERAYEAAHDMTMEWLDTIEITVARLQEITGVGTCSARTWKERFAFMSKLLDAYNGNMGWRVAGDHYFVHEAPCDYVGTVSDDESSAS